MDFWSKLTRNLIFELMANGRFGFLHFFELPGSDFTVTSMLVTDVGDQMCW